MDIRSPFPESFSFASLSNKVAHLHEHPESELSALSPQASVKRRAEFVLGRKAAHAALSGVDRQKEWGNFSILKGTRGEPLWPEGITGSISHSDGIACAVVARAQDTIGVGLDLQRKRESRRRDLLKVICTKREIEWINSAADAEEREVRQLLIFSAKESLYKALYPVTRKYFGFHGAELSPVEKQGAFHVELHSDVHRRRFSENSIEIGYNLLPEWYLTFVVVK